MTLGISLMNSESDPWWQSLFRLCRPGSRTVLCNPVDAMAIDFARHGFRLMVLRPEGSGVDALRHDLRNVGLSSQLMGSQSYLPDSRPSLVQDFYELWIFCDEPLPQLWQAAHTSLKKGSPIYWRSQYSVLPTPEALLEGLPTQLSGVRI